MSRGTRRSIRPRHATALAVAIGLALAACGGDDGGSTDDGAPSTEAAASTEAPAAAVEMTISGVVQLDAGAADSTMCPYVDDATAGRVFLNPVGDFTGFFQTVTDGSDPEYLSELVGGEVVIAKGTTVSITGSTEFSEMRCTQGDQTEIRISSITPAG